MGALGISNVVRLPLAHPPLELTARPAGAEWLITLAWLVCPAIVGARLAVGQTTE
jgi:hypothetical protein